MKPLTVAISIAVLALPLCAADQSKQKTASTVLSQQPAAQKEDSVLVRAARASGQATRKATVVITNETLVTSGGYFTTTDATPPLPNSGQAGPATEDAARN